VDFSCDSGFGGMSWQHSTAGQAWLASHPDGEPPPWADGGSAKPQRQQTSDTYGDDDEQPVMSWQHSTAGQAWLASHPNGPPPPWARGGSAKPQPAPKQTADTYGDDDEQPVMSWQHSTAGQAWLASHPNGPPPPWAGGGNASPAKKPAATYHPAVMGWEQMGWRHSTAGQMWAQSHPDGEEPNWDSAPAPAPKRAPEPVRMSTEHSTAGQFARASRQPASDDFDGYTGPPAKPSRKASAGRSKETTAKPKAKAKPRAQASNAKSKAKKKNG
jgi:hypothetical protein